MAARSSGLFPREGFDLDEQLKLTTSQAAISGVTLKYAKTIRVIGLGITGIDNAGTNKITVTVGGQAVVFQAQDADPNGVYIAHIRGALCDVTNTAGYAVGGTGTVAAGGGIFLQLVDYAAK
jgi:hypothetical protein